MERKAWPDTGVPGNPRGTTTTTPYDRSVVGTGIDLSQIWLSNTGSPALCAKGPTVLQVRAVLLKPLLFWGGSVWGTLILCWSSWVVGQFGQAPPPESSTGETLQWRIDTWKLESHCHPEERTIYFYVSMPVPLYWSLRFIAAEAHKASSLGKVFTTQIQGLEFDSPPPPRSCAKTGHSSTSL